MSDIATQKKCSKCGVVKGVEEFYKNKSKKDGYSDQCKICGRQCRKQYRETNPEKIRQEKKRYREANRDKAKLLSKQYREANPEKIKQSGKQYRKANPGKEKQKSKQRVENLPEYYILNILKITKSDILLAEEVLKEFGMTLDQLIAIKRQGILAFRREHGKS